MTSVGGIFLPIPNVVAIIVLFLFCPCPSTPSRRSASCPNPKTIPRNPPCVHNRPSTLASSTMIPSQRDTSQPDPHQDTHDFDNGSIEDRLCPGCKKSAVTEHGGLVVAFGCVSFASMLPPSVYLADRSIYSYFSQSFFHVDCFKCAKCGNQVTADTNLLLLSDGSPICANCSYSCNVCRLPILDEAIMTGDDSYHAHCFKCKVCESRIDELVFAKTSHGIYCMNCHSKRMIKLREHAQKKAERAKEKAAGGSGSMKSREREARNFHQENGVRSLYFEQLQQFSYYHRHPRHEQRHMQVTQTLQGSTLPPILAHRALEA